MNFKEDQAYYIEAYDHSMGTDELLTVGVVGWVIGQDDIRVTLAWWIAHSKDKDVRDDNMEKFVILKSTITKKIALPKMPRRVK